MPKKETRESIEAELNASERDRLLKKLEDMAKDWHMVVADLCAREDQQGLPTFYRSKPLVERMAAVGMSKEAIERVRTWLAVITTIDRTNSVNDLPADIRLELAEAADAEISALDQLQDVLEAARRLKQ
jgi:hypothetical protein